MMFGIQARRPAVRVPTRWLAILAVPVCSPVELDAADISWINASGGTFSTVSNWSDLPNLPDRAPGVNDVAHFGPIPPTLIPQTYTVSFVTNPTNQAFDVADDNVTFDLNGRVYAVTRGGSAVTSHQGGLLTIVDGTVALSSASQTQSALIADGVITVSSGGLLAGSLAGLNIGSGASTGRLVVENNGDVIVDEVTLAAAAGAGRGYIDVTGGGSTLLAGAMTIGKTGGGFLQVKSGGVVQTASSILGFGGGTTGTVLVQGAGSRWTAGDLTVGRLGEGQLTITQGGLVTCTDASLSSGQDLFIIPGMVRVLDEGRFEVNGRLDLTFNQSGTALLDILPGGTVRVTQDVQVGFRGIIKLEGGTFQASSIIFKESEDSVSNFEWTAGTLHVGTFLGDLVNSSGVLAPGASAGTTTIDGDYQHLAAATLEIEIGGRVPGTQHDLVNVTGDVFLEGSLQLSPLHGFLPAASDVFTILGTMGSFTGSFANVASGQRLATSDRAGSFIVNYGPGSPLDPQRVMLSGFQAITPGDFDLDGDVDGADLLLWQRGGSPSPNSAGDLAAWRGNFGFGASVPLAAAVPEPPAFSLLALAAIYPRRRAAGPRRVRPAARSVE